MSRSQPRRHDGRWSAVQHDEPATGLSDNSPEAKIHRRLQDMVAFLGTARRIVERGEGEFRTDAINLHAAKSIIVDLNSAADEIKRIDPGFLTAHPEIPWSDLNKNRSKFAHHYEGIEIARVWDTISVDLPALDQVLRRILEEN